MVKVVARRDQAAFELLVFISFIGHYVSRPVLLHYFRTFFREGTQIHVPFAYAIGELKKYCLIQYEPSTGSKGYIVIHPFTKDVLRQEFDSRLEDTLIRILDVAVPMLDQPPPPFTAAAHEDYHKFIDEFNSRGMNELHHHLIIAVMHWIDRQPDEFRSRSPEQQSQTLIEVRLRRRARS